MKPTQFPRRHFLRVSLLFTAGAAVAACEPPLPQETPQASGSATNLLEPTPSGTPSPTPLPRGKIALLGKDADVWAWKKRVSVQATGLDDCNKSSIEVNGQEAPLNPGESENTYSAEISLLEGENRVIVAFCKPDGSEVRSNMLTYRERLRDSPKAVIRIAMQGSTIVIDGSQSTASEGSGQAIIDHIWSARPGNPTPLVLQGLSGMESREFTGEVSSPVISVLPPTMDGEYTLRLLVKDATGRQDSSDIYFVVENGQARIPEYDRENTVWVERAIIYGVIPSKFGSPGFMAITSRLDYLADLGINALWLAPINKSPAGDYGYAVVDYFELNPAYGTKEDFHRLVQEAHARGIRVLMDFVPNHSSVEHPYFQDTLKNGDASPYWDFYDRDEFGQPTHYFGWEHLPNLNYNNPEVERWMLEAFSYWVREFDVDGFRVDVAWGVKQRKPDFWPKWRRELKRIKPDLLLLAEASARDPYYFENGFDAAYDWTDQLGNWSWELVWGSYKHRQLAYNLNTALTNRPDGLHPDTLVFRFLNNNDTGQRFITRHGEAFTRVATAMLLTLPGIPCIYTGDEVGAEFHPYQSEGPISWNESSPGLRDYHKKLISLRNEVPSLHSRSWKPVEISPSHPQVYGYLRFIEPNEQPVLVLLNYSQEQVEVELALPEEFLYMAQAGHLYDLLDEQAPIAVDDPLRIKLESLSARILMPE